MEISKRSILSTKALGYEALTLLNKEDIAIDVIPFIDIEKSAPKSDIDLYAHKNVNVIFTSANAVNAVIQQLQCVPEWNIYCLNGATQKAVTNYWNVQNVIASAKNAELLLHKILHEENTCISEVIFFCGNKRLDTIPTTLKQYNVNVVEHVVYNTILTPVKVQKKYDAIMFFSPSATDSFFSINDIPDTTLLIAIGDTTANALAKYSDNKIVISDEPGEVAMINKLINY